MGAYLEKRYKEGITNLRVIGVKSFNYLITNVYDIETNEEISDYINEVYNGYAGDIIISNSKIYKYNTPVGEEYCLILENEFVYVPIVYNGNILVLKRNCESKYLTSYRGTSDIKKCITWNGNFFFFNLIHLKTLAHGYEVLEEDENKVVFCVDDDVVLEAYKSLDYLVSEVIDTKNNIQDSKVIGIKNNIQESKVINTENIQESTSQKYDYKDFQSREVLKLKGKNIGLYVVDKFDRELLMKWVSDLEIARFIGTSTSLTWKQEDKIREDAIKYDSIEFLVRELKTGVPIGKCSIEKHGKDRYELGVLIGEKDYWGRGYGIELVKLMLKFCFSYLDAHSVYLWLSDKNVRARQVYDKCGFKEVGHAHDTNRWDGEWSGSYLMEMLENEYRSMN